MLKYNSNTCIGKLDPNQDECLDKEQCGQSEKPTTNSFLGIKKCFKRFHAKHVSFYFTAIYEYLSVMLVDVEWAGSVFATYTNIPWACVRSTWASNNHGTYAFIKYWVNMKLGPLTKLVQVCYAYT